MPKEVPYLVLYISEYGGAGQPAVQIIDNRKTFLEMWEEFTGTLETDVPNFNPDTEILIRKDFQSQNTGGSQYIVNSVVRDGNKIIISYSVVHEGLYATDAITNPVMLIKIDKILNPEVDFVLQLNN